MPPTGRGAASDAAVQTVTVANTPPTAGSAAIKPASPSTNDVLKAVPSGFADVDADALTYTYQWYRNGTAIAGATGRTLDLARGRQRRSRRHHRRRRDRR